MGEEIRRTTTAPARRRRGASRLARYVRFVARLHLHRFLITFAVGVAVMVLMHWDRFERSLLGGPDRGMLETAFKLRADLVKTPADPVLFIDLDDQTLAMLQPAGQWPHAPAAIAPRDLVARLIAYLAAAPPDQRPGAVILDVDLATMEIDDAGRTAMRQALAAWRAQPGAPLLVLARQAFPSTALGMAPGDPRLVSPAATRDRPLVLPATDFDDLVAGATDLRWGSVKVQTDNNGVVREFTPFECVAVAGAPAAPLLSVVWSAYDALLVHDAERGHATGGSTQTRHAETCRPGEPTPAGTLINFHISLEAGGEHRVWPSLPASWRGGCGDRAIFRRLSARDVLAAGPRASHLPLCDRLVIIGGTNVAAADFRQTPLSEMPGSIILANAVRGLQLTKGPLRRAPLPIQIVVLLPVTIAVCGGFTLTRQIRRRYRRFLRLYPTKSLAIRIRLLPLNPVVLSSILAFTAHGLGILLLMVSLKYGYWGYMSAAAVASAVSETIQEFAADER